MKWRIIIRKDNGSGFLFYPAKYESHQEAQDFLNGFPKTISGKCMVVDQETFDAYRMNQNLATSA